MAPLTRHETPWTLSDAQYRVISHGQLVALGYSADAIKHRIRRGRLHPVHRGVYAVGHRQLTDEGEWMAAVLACGDGAALSHQSAGAHRGIVKRVPTKPVHVSVPGQSRSRNGIVVHRPRELHATTYRGIRVTTPEQTLIDLAPTYADIEQAIGEAVLRRRTTQRRLQTAAAKAGRPGAPLRAIIGRLTFRVTQSELEREFLRLVERAGVPTPDTQTRFGKHRVDFHWPALGLVTETDGGRFHATAAQQEQDRRRDHAHIRAGRTPIRLTHWQAFHDQAPTTAILVDVVGRLTGSGGTADQH